MKKVVLGVLIVFGFNVWSYGAEIGKSKFFVGAACNNRTDSMYANVFIMIKMANGVTQELLNYLEKEVTSKKGCHFISVENIKFNVFKKTQDKIRLQKGGDEVLVHNALVSLLTMEGKSLKTLANDDKLAKVLSGVKLWISRPYFDDNYRKNFPLLTFKNGKTW